jgi:hypothetical protein
MVILEKIKEFFFKDEKGNVKKLANISNINSAKLYLSFNRYKHEGSELDAESEVIYPDGLMSVNNHAYSLTYRDEYGVLMSNIVNIDNSTLIKKYKIENLDLFVGRDSNNIIFRTNLLLQIENKNTTISSLENISLNTGKFILNGIELNVIGGKLYINNKEIAVVGAESDATTHKIINSGQ